MMRSEKISGSISLIDPKYIDEAADFAADSPVNDGPVGDNGSPGIIKRSKAVFVICAAALITAISIVISVAATRSVSGPPSMEDELVSGYVNSYVPTEKDYIRTDIYDELNSRKDKLRQEMTANGKDAREAFSDAEDQVKYEQAMESAEILKKYNKLNNDFSFNSANDLKTVMWAACDLINSSDSINIRDQVFLEMFLIAFYPYDDEGLRTTIDNTVPQGYKRNTFYRRESEQNRNSQQEEISR